MSFMKYKGHLAERKSDYPLDVQIRKLFTDSEKQSCDAINCKGQVIECLQCLVGELADKVVCIDNTLYDVIVDSAEPIKEGFNHELKTFEFIVDKNNSSTLGGLLYTALYNKEIKE